MREYMREYRYKFSVIFYILAAAVLFIGWYPAEKSNVNIISFVQQTSQSVDRLCALQENNKLFEQTVKETDTAQRKQSEQEAENERRKAKIVQRKKAVSAMGIGNSGVEILERIVEAEAGDQNVKGRMLVANVILNRVKSKQFPNTIKKVVFAHRQFSPVSNGSYYRVTVSKTTKNAVKKALNGMDESKGALYFMCRSASNPDNVRWFDRDLTRLFSYGCHEFFR